MRDSLSLVDCRASCAVVSPACAVITFWLWPVRACLSAIWAACTLGTRSLHLRWLGRVGQRRLCRVRDLLLGLGVLQLRLGDLERGLGLVHFSSNARVSSAAWQLVFLDRVAFFDQHLGDSVGDLEGQIGVLERLDFADSIDAAAKCLRKCLGRLQGRRGRLRLGGGRWRARRGPMPRAASPARQRAQPISGA